MARQAGEAGYASHRALGVLLTRRTGGEAEPDDQVKNKEDSPKQNHYSGKKASWLHRENIPASIF